MALFEPTQLYIGGKIDLRMIWAFIRYSHRYLDALRATNHAHFQNFQPHIQMILSTGGVYKQNPSNNTLSHITEECMRSDWKSTNDDFFLCWSNFYMFCLTSLSFLSLCNCDISILHVFIFCVVSFYLCVLLIFVFKMCSDCLSRKLVVMRRFFNLSLLIILCRG